MDTITSVTLEQVGEILEAHGYDVVNQGNSLAVQVGAAECPLPAVVVLSDERLKFAVELATFADLKDDEGVQAGLLYDSLKMTSDLDPFAVDLVTPDEDDPTVQTVEQTKIALIDSMSAVGADENEVVEEIQALQNAIALFVPVLRDALEA
jgi:hypothetical protein